MPDGRRFASRCRPGRTTHLNLWIHWIPPDFVRLFPWVIDAMDFLNIFVQQVVNARKEEDERGSSWTWWIRQDPRSHSEKWLRPDLAPPALCLNLRVHFGFLTLLTLETRDFLPSPHVRQSLVGCLRRLMGTGTGFLARFTLKSGHYSNGPLMCGSHSWVSALLVEYRNLIHLGMTSGTCCRILRYVFACGSTLMRQSSELSHYFTQFYMKVDSLTPTCTSYPAALAGCLGHLRSTRFFPPGRRLQEMYRWLLKNVSPFSM